MEALKVVNVCNPVNCSTEERNMLSFLYDMFSTTSYLKVCRHYCYGHLHHFRFYPLCHYRYYIKMYNIKCVCVCVVIVIVKRLVLPPSVVDGRSRNPLYYYYYYICFMVLTVKWLELWTWISVNFFFFLSNMIFWNLMSDRSTAIHRAPDFVFIIIPKLFFVILKFSESCYEVWVPDDLELAG